MEKRIEKIAEPQAESSTRSPAAVPLCSDAPALNAVSSFTKEKREAKAAIDMRKGLGGLSVSRAAFVAAGGTDEEFDQYDLDGSDSLCMSELEARAYANRDINNSSPASPETVPQRVTRAQFVGFGGTEAAFEMYDHNQDGVLDASELEARKKAQAQAAIDFASISRAGRVELEQQAPQCTLTRSVDHVKRLPSLSHIESDDTGSQREQSTIERVVLQAAKALNQDVELGAPESVGHQSLLHERMDASL